MDNPAFTHAVELRVRYADTDQLGTYYNSRPLEWFEVGRTELLRALGISYAEMETRGLCLPLVEAHVTYRGRARYDDLLKVAARLTVAGKASLRFDMEVVQAATGAPVAAGYTTHAMTDNAGKPIRCPPWLTEALTQRNPLHG